MAIFSASALLYSMLPEQIPMQWGLGGEVSKYGGKSSIYILPIAAALLNLLLKYLPGIDPSKQNYKDFEKEYHFFRVVMVVFMAVLQTFILYRSIYKESTLRVDIFVLLMVSVLFFVIGVIMPKIKQNYFMGIRTPWTLSSEAVWTKTHQAAGILWKIGGVLMGLCLLLPAMLRLYSFLAIVLAVVLISVIYSYVIFKKMQKKQ